MCVCACVCVRVGVASDRSVTGRDQLAGLEDDVYDKMLDMNS